uniref:Roc domain-containing protein n=1 Tax=Spongospora subterranea TaxID=70186 RepID=A0A0H5R765_9EUKA|eukprot:CRZ09666.1 hypothetical protein [Spongospora subterranea]
MLKTRAGKNGGRQIQVLIVGASGSGKTALVSRILSEEFPNKHIPTLGAELFIKEMQFQEEYVTLNLWSCGGHERFKPVVQHLYDNINGAIITYDRTNEASFREVAFWRNEMLRCYPSCVAIVVGLKSDLNELANISVQDAEEQTARWSLSHWIASAKTGENIDAVVNQMLTRLMAKT